jgi:hypothetical protein
MNTDTPQIFRYFSSAHLPEKLAATSRKFEEVAQWLIQNVPDSAERQVALRKLLEGKDAAVRAML